jgi:hypothetical protein
MNASTPSHPRSLETIRIASRAALVAIVAATIWSLGSPPGWQTPTGIDIVRGPIPDPFTAALWRGAALVFVGTTLFDLRSEKRVGAIGPKGVALCLGILATVVGLFGLLTSDSALGHPMAIATLLALGTALFTSADREPKEPDGQEREPKAPDLPITRAAQAGLFLSGIGMAIALQSLDMRLDLFGYGEPAEDSLRLVILLVLAAFGALAFGTPLISAAARRSALDLAPLAVTAACLAGLWLLSPLTGYMGLDSFLRAFGTDLAAIGTPKGTALIAARGLFLPGICLGLVLSVTGRKASFKALMTGLGLGIILMPLLLSLVAGAPLGDTEVAHAMRLVKVGSLIALLGSWLMLSAAKGPVSGLRRQLSALGTLALLGLIMLFPKASIRPLSPWLNFEPEPGLVADTPFGLLTVEPAKDGSNVLTLNRYRLTPDAEFSASENSQLQASLDLIASAVDQGIGRPIRVLLAGQMTTPRWEALRTWELMSGREAELDWTVPWEQTNDAIRPYFEFAGALKDPVSQELARERLDNGHYDLVLTLATYGPGITAMAAKAPPMAPGLLAGAGASAGKALAVVWMDTRVPLARVQLNGRALLAGSDLEHMAVGLVTWPAGLHRDAGTRPISQVIADSRSGLERLQKRPELRVFGDRAELFGRLAQDGDAAFLAAIAALLEEQIESSPWADPDVRFEIEGELLQALAQATPGAASGFERMVWNHLARVLVAKRLPGVSYEVLPDLLEKTPGPWPELEYALSRAYQEFLMPAEAAALLSPLFDAGQLNLIPLLEYAAVEGQQGNWPRAAEILARALATSPDNHNIERHLAIAEMQAGLASGVERIKHLLAEDPDDPHNAELDAYLQPGPMPAAPVGFDPNPLGGHEEH